MHKREAQFRSCPPIIAEVSSRRTFTSDIHTHTLTHTLTHSHTHTPKLQTTSPICVSQPLRYSFSASPPPPPSDGLHPPHLPSATFVHRTLPPCPPLFKTPRHLLTPQLSTPPLWVQATMGSTGSLNRSCRAMAQIRDLQLDLTAGRRTPWTPLRVSGSAGDVARRSYITDGGRSGLVAGLGIATNRKELKE